VTGGAGVTFVAEAADAAALLAKISGDNQTGLTPNTDSSPLVVRVTRSGSGAAISGAQIRWSGANAQFLASDGALVTEVSSITDAQGEARIVARVINSGPATVTARGQGFSTEAVTFTLQGAIANLENLTGRERDVAEAIDAACPALAALGSRSPEQDDFLQRCRELQRNSGDNPDQVEDALQQMTPDIGITLASAGEEVLSTQMSNVTNYLMEARRNPQGGGQMDIGMLTADGVLPLSFLPSAILSGASDEAEGSAEGQELGSGFSRWGFFATGQIGRGKYRDGDRTPDYEYDSGHLTAGVDYRFNDNVIAGIALGFSRSTTELRDDTGELETSGWSLLGYGTWYNEALWYVDASLTLGSNDYDLTRLVRYDITAADGTTTQVNQVADASTSGDQLGATLSVGRDFQRGAWSFSTYVRGLYMKSEYDAYTERMLANQAGAGLALTVEARELTAVNGTLGGRASYVMSRDWGILMPHALLEFEHRFEDDPAQLVARFAFDPTSTVFLQTGDEIDSDVVNVGLGLSALWPGGRSAFVQYERLMSASQLSQDTLSIGVRIEF
jgi:outer membrane autotransporter protein